MTKWALLFTVAFLVALVAYKAGSYEVHPYNGNALGVKVNDECAGIVTKYMPLGKRTRLSLDKYAEMSNELSRCMARK